MFAWKSRKKLIPLIRSLWAALTFSEIQDTTNNSIVLAYSRGEPQKNQHETYGGSKRIFTSPEIFRILNMNATKRKFNALINGLGNKSTTSLHSQPQDFLPARSSLDAGGESAIKKRRLIQPSSTEFRSSTHRSSDVSSRRAGLMHKKATSMASSGLPDEPPSYAPWDRNAFLDRLKTFSNLTDWTDKPPKVNEVEWAKRGWVCKGSERVRCTSCNVELLVKLNKREGADGKEEYVFNANEIEQALVDKYAEMIINSHVENCLWKQRGCDDTIFKLPLNNPPTTLKALRERYDSLYSLRENLPYLHNMHPPSDFSTDEVMKYLPKDFFMPKTGQNEVSATPEVNRVAFMMACFGWQRRPAIKYRDGAAWCPVCFRTLGLWLYKTKKVDEDGNEIERATVSCLDPVVEHRFYCPWKSAESQNGDKPSSTGGSSQLAAWQILIRVLKNDYILHHGVENQPRKHVSDSQNTDNDGESITRFTGELESEDARSVRELKDKERWARLRRVKSLFDTKTGKKLQRPNIL